MHVSHTFDLRVSDLFILYSPHRIILLMTRMFVCANFLCHISFQAIFVLSRMSFRVSLSIEATQFIALIA